LSLALDCTENNTLYPLAKKVVQVCNILLSPVDLKLLSADFYGYCGIAVLLSIRAIVMLLPDFLVGMCWLAMLDCQPVFPLASKNKTYTHIMTFWI